MAARYSDEFRRDAVRIATTSGLTRPQIASDLGVGVSTLNKWVGIVRLKCFAKVEPRIWSDFGYNCLAFPQATQLTFPNPSLDWGRQDAQQCLF
jgi:hypothetical protein